MGRSSLYAKFCVCQCDSLIIVRVCQLSILKTFIQLQACYGIIHEMSTDQSMTNEESINYTSTTIHKEKR